jgi:hypothetical protein
MYSSQPLATIQTMSTPEKPKLTGDAADMFSTLYTIITENNNKPYSFDNHPADLARLDTLVRRKKSNVNLKHIIQFVDQLDVLDKDDQRWIVFKRVETFDEFQSFIYNKIIAISNDSEVWSVEEDYDKLEELAEMIYTETPIATIMFHACDGEMVDPDHEDWKCLERAAQDATDYKSVVNNLTSSNNCNNE